MKKQPNKTTMLSKDSKDKASKHDTKMDQLTAEAKEDFIAREALLNKARAKAEAEEVEEHQGHVGLKERYRTPRPILYPDFHNAEAIKKDADFRADISTGIANIERMQQQVKKDQIEIERLKNETRLIIGKVLSI